MKKTEKIVLTGVFGALIVVFTAYVKIPAVTGYINLGDGFLYTCAGLLGYFAAIPAAIGSALADLLAGYPIYIPVTFVVKGFMALFAAYLLKRLPKRWSFIAFIPPALVMILGYFIYEWALYGVMTAGANIVGNCIQGVAGVVVGAILVPIVTRVKYFQN